MPRKILVAVDGSGTSDHALSWASVHVAHSGDELHIVTVMPPINYSAYPAATFATPVGALSQQWAGQRQQDEEMAAEVLTKAASHSMVHGVQRQQLHAHALPAAGGASGVAESIVEFSSAKEVDLVVLGSRGMGAVKRSLMNLAGLGSVSDYCVQHLRLPSLVVRADAPVLQPNQPRTVVIAVDDSPHSAAAVKWAAANVLGSHLDTVHVVAVALPMPYPILDEQTPAMAALEMQEWQASAQRCLDHATQVAGRSAAALEVPHGKLPAASVVRAALSPEGGASDVGVSVCKYATQHKAVMVVVGSRGMGSFKASLLGLVGLGSVSTYLLHSLTCPVAVVKASEEVAAAAAAALLTAAPCDADDAGAKAH